MGAATTGLDSLRLPRPYRESAPTLSTSFANAMAARSTTSARRASAARRLRVSTITARPRDSSTTRPGGSRSRPAGNSNTADFRPFTACPSASAEAVPAGVPQPLGQFARRRPHTPRQARQVGRVPQVVGLLRRQPALGAAKAELRLLEGDQQTLQRRGVAQRRPGADGLGCPAHGLDPKPNASDFNVVSEGHEQDSREVGHRNPSRFNRPVPPNQRDRCHLTGA